MPIDVIDTVAEPVESEISGSELAVAVVAACGRTPQGNMCARPVAPQELVLADSATLRDAIRSTIPPKWLELLPNLDAELNGATDDQLRMLLVMNASFWCMGRIEGTIEERNRNADG